MVAAVACSEGHALETGTIPTLEEASNKTALDSVACTTVSTWRAQTKQTLSTSFLHCGHAGSQNEQAHTHTHMHAQFCSCTQMPGR